MSTTPRENWGSRLGFVLAAAGSAIGLGNIWKFPFEVADGGGGAFVVIYLLCCFVLCFPVMVTELAIGRKTEKNPVGAFAALGFPKWKFVGYIGVVAGILILSFYNVVAGWALGYVFELAAGNFAIGSAFGAYIADASRLLGYSTVFMILTFFIVRGGVSSGIERASKILMPTLLTILVGLVIYGLTLEHAWKGVEFYLVPDFSKVNFEVVYNALGQAFFSLSLGMGTLMTYGSYLSKKENIIKSATYITLADVGIALVAGLLMFPLVAYLNAGDMSNVTGGAGLIFAVLPGAFETLGDSAGPIIGALFFTLLSFAALTSTVSLLEVPTAFLIDEFKMSRKLSAGLMAALIFVIGLPSMLSNGAWDVVSSGFLHYGGADRSFMDLVEHISSDSLLPLGGCLIVLFASYAWRSENLSEELSIGAPGFKGSLLERFINVSVAYIAPIILATIFVLTLLDRFFGVSLI